MKKGQAFIPFRFRLSPIKKSAIVHFHKSPDSEYEALELHYFDGEPFGKGYRVLAWRRDGYMDSYLQNDLTIPEEDEVFTVGGKGLKERHQVNFEEISFEHVEGQLKVKIDFYDKLNRRIVLNVNEEIDKNTKSINWVPSVGHELENPRSLPLFFYYDFDFARKRDTEVSFSIDGEAKQVDPFAIPKNLQSRLYIEFSTNVVMTNFNEAGKFTLDEASIDERGIAKGKNQTYEYESKNDVYRLKKITVNHETHPVKVTFDPAFPSHKEVTESKPIYGEFEIHPAAEAGYLRGKYNVVYQKGKAVINLSFPDSWNIPKGANYERIINTVTPNLTTWYQTYQCTQVVDLETMEATANWKRINPTSRSSY